MPISYADVIDIPGITKGERAEPDAPLEGPGVKKFVYAGNNIIASVEEPGIKYYHKGRMSNRITTDSSGDLDKEFKSLSFGQMIENSGVDYPFTGKEEDESGLHYFGARYYDDNVGRFTSVDPMAGNDGNLPYGYVANNPMNLVDPDGMELQFLISFYDSDPDINRQLANNRISELNDFFGADVLQMGDEGHVIMDGDLNYVGDERQQQILEVFNTLIESEDLFEVVSTQESDPTFFGSCAVKGTNRLILGKESKMTFERPLGKNLENVKFDPLMNFVHEATHLTGEGEEGAVRMTNLLRGGVKRHFYTASTANALVFAQGPPDESYFYLTPEQFDSINIITDFFERRGAIRELGTRGPNYPELVKKISN